jgi:hypothetical protein
MIPRDASDQKVAWVPTASPELGEPAEAAPTSVAGQILADARRPPDFPARRLARPQWSDAAET